MYSEDDLASAIKAGVISEETAAAFRAHVASTQVTPAVDEEYFRLVTGFNDIFVVIACVLLLASVSGIGAVASPWIGGLLEAVMAWILCEFFVKTRRMALPAIVLLLAFVGGASMVGVLLSKGPVLGGICGVIAAFMHWRRFKVPITVAAGAGALIAGLASTLVAKKSVAEWVPLLLFIAGAITFLFALRWDASDRQRETRRSDVAFWLHLLAAPLLVHPVFVTLKPFHGEANAAQALSVLLLYVVITMISLISDRRALMVSALAYVLYAFSALLKDYGVVNLSFAITGLLIGSGLLLLSAFWNSSRGYLLRRLPEAWQRRMAPLR